MSSDNSTAGGDMATGHVLGHVYASGDEAGGGCVVGKQEMEK